MEICGIKAATFSTVEDALDWLKTVDRPAKSSECPGTVIPYQLSEIEGDEEDGDELQE
jgi:hypothetical protein